MISEVFFRVGVQIFGNDNYWTTICLNFRIYSPESQMVKSHHLSLLRPPRGCLSKYIFIVMFEVVATSNQCLRTYNSGLPWRHFPVSRQVRSTAAILMVRPRHTNSRGSPGSPTAIREVSHVATTGLMTSLTNRSGMITVSLFFIKFINS
jgi:hypothetical protein